MSVNKGMMSKGANSTLRLMSFTTAFWVYWIVWLQISMTEAAALSSLMQMVGVLRPISGLVLLVF
jgi:hypothetical protein